MKKILLLVAVATMVFACSKKTDYVIEGKITNAAGKYIYLDELRVSSSQPIDSVKISKKGEFKFTGHIGYPNFFLLRLSEKNFITLLVDSAEHVQVFGDAANFSRDYAVIGSPGSQLVQELNKKLTTTKLKLDSIHSLQVIFRNRPNFNEKNAEWETECQQIIKEQVDYSTNFVQKNPFSMSSILALYQKFDDANYVVQDLQSLKVAASALNSIYPKSEHVKALYANTVRLMSSEKSIKMQQLIQKAGTNSPDIKLPDMNGTQVSLSSLQGKVVLLQFWSARDRASRIMNPALVELYNKYKNRGFEIYQVSIDQEKNEWVNAIREDGLNWINVGDMRGSIAAVNAYNIQTLPFNYLLDKEGVIVGKNLKGPALDKAVGSILK